MENALRTIKDHPWFYEFELPDGTRTKSVLPPHIAGIHASLRDKLRRIIADLIPPEERVTALDLASHEGFYSFELGRQFARVIGYEARDENIEGARLMADALGAGNVEFRPADLQTLGALEPADLVMSFGLFYHLQDPVRVLRLAANAARKHILIETQVTGFEVGGRIERGSHLIQNDVHGTFALVTDYPDVNVGGITNVALVPSLNALLFLLRTFGFATVEVIPPEADDYEQFVRGHRVLVYGRK